MKVKFDVSVGNTGSRKVYCKLIKKYCLYTRVVMVVEIQARVPKNRRYVVKLNMRLKKITSVFETVEKKLLILSISLLVVNLGIDSIMTKPYIPQKNLFQ